MDIRVYQTLPQESRDIRTAVFVHEQGFREEFDTTDNIATHLVVHKSTLTAIYCG